ncbi:MAG: YitT family protein [Ruminococcaceae bacterium]|nr:YitT family protein [Oscillospiraceae bacterium]
MKQFFKGRGGSAAWAYFRTMVYAVANALVCEIFVFPNNFAPSGINGIATMIQYLLGIDVGYLSLIVNIPMLVVAYFVLERRYALRTAAHSLTFSFTLILLSFFDLTPIIYQATDTGGGILAALAGGLFSGALYSFSVRLGGSTGGTDVVAAFINHRYPEYDTVWIIFALNVSVAVASFFVYGMEYQPVILCALYVFVSSKVSDSIFKGARAAAKFEVVTTHPEELAEELMKKLRHGCTLLPAKGMYTKMEKSMLVCVVNTRQVVEFERIIRKYDNTFAYISTVNGTVGEFHKRKNKK